MIGLTEKRGDLYFVTAIPRIFSIDASPSHVLLPPTPSMNELWLLVSVKLPFLP